MPRGIVVVGGRLCVDLDTSRGIGVWFVLIAHRVGFDFGSAVNLVKVIRFLRIMRERSGI